ncbi:hypothetical protein ACG02S_10205 [Roseateles sp. DC23W]|uniref:DUF1700 domain-containing protein n=1 Tax=Pelomonas dachongensis TaxID=3299029 RepID=A0ABW7EM54_9BURK
MMFANEKKRRSLEALYRAMPTSELKRRLRAGGLAAPARQAAEAELQRRSSPGASDVEPMPSSGDDGGRAGIVRAVVGVVAAGALAWFVVSPEMAMFVPVLVLPWLLAPAAKAFPRLGLVIGSLLVLLPLALLAWAWMGGHLAWRSGDYRPLGTLLAWGVLIFAFLVCWSLASMLIWGARHRGSWRGMHRRLQKMREEQVDALK